MIKLIIDSGSTTADCLLMRKGYNSENQVVTSSMVGINPIFNTDKEILTAINDLKNSICLPYLQLETKLDIYFYSAGLVSDDQKRRVSKLFEDVFPNAQIFCESDIVAAVRACSAQEPAIVGILGTGSNVCFYDGRAISHNVYSGGFILGDQGSGANLGKLLLADYIKGLVPEEVKQKLELEYQVDYSTIVAKVYKEAMPSRYLASFAKFIHQNKENPYIYRLVDQAFSDFFEKCVKAYDYEKYPLYLVGSIAHYFEENIRECAEKFFIKIAKIIERPILGLETYHLKY